MDEQKTSCSYPLPAYKKTIHFTTEKQTQIKKKKNINLRIFSFPFAPELSAAKVAGRNPRHYHVIALLREATAVLPFLHETLMGLSRDPAL